MTLSSRSTPGLLQAEPEGEIRFEPRIFELGPAAEFEFAGALARLSGLRGLAALDSADFEGFEPRDAGEAWIAFEPRVDLTGDRPASAAFQAAERVRTLSPVPGRFQGGFLGALAYDLGVELGGAASPWASAHAGSSAPAAPFLPSDPLRTPGIVGGLYTNFVHVARGGVASLVIDGADPGAQELEARVRAALAGPLPELEQLTPTGALRRLTSSAEHRARIEAIRERIAAGDLYQANLCHRSTLPCLGDPLELYLRLRQANPAPYMAFLQHAGGAIVSSSPELLLDLTPAAENRPAVARTQPIKGTAPRSSDPVQDAQLASALNRSPKDRAELAMIVDLERNDLGRWARPGGVQVARFPVLRSFARVHHLLADVTAELVPEARAAEVFASLFPGGSITGAPKLAALETLAHLEGEGRGHFTGSLGFASSCGAARFNILIRTWLHRRCAERGDFLSLSVGGGITYDSDAEQEDRETGHKARALLEAIGLDPESLP